MGVLSNLFSLSQQYSQPTILNIIWTQTGITIMYHVFGNAYLSSLIAAVQADEGEGLHFFLFIKATAICLIQGKGIDKCNSDPT